MLAGLEDNWKSEEIIGFSQQLGKMVKTVYYRNTRNVIAICYIDICYYVLCHGFRQVYFMCDKVLIRQAGLPPDQRRNDNHH